MNHLESQNLWKLLEKSKDRQVIFRFGENGNCSQRVVKNLKRKFSRYEIYFCHHKISYYYNLLANEIFEKRISGMQSPGNWNSTVSFSFGGINNKTISSENDDKFWISDVNELCDQFYKSQSIADIFQFENSHIETYAIIGDGFSFRVNYFIAYYLNLVTKSEVLGSTDKIIYDLDKIICKYPSDLIRFYSAESLVSYIREFILKKN